MSGPYEPFSLADAVEQGIMTGQDLSCREMLTSPVGIEVLPTMGFDHRADARAPGAMNWAWPPAT